MLLINPRLDKVGIRIKRISIHLMLLINFYQYLKLHSMCYISIHLMLLINFKELAAPCPIAISIHLMLLINVMELFYFTVWLNFNTSNVINQRLYHFIHLWRHNYFNTSNVINQHGGVNYKIMKYKLFQYI